MYAVIYTRISQDTSGEGAGVARQLEDCQTLAEQLGATTVDHYDDNDISAFNGKTRPGFEAMLDMLKRGQADTIIVWHVDRLYRSLKDLERLIDIVDTHQVAIRTVNSGDVDLSNATGKMVARILGSVARQESEHKGERRRRANLQRAQAGAWRADQRRPFGYTQHGELVPEEAAAIRQAIPDVLDGRSLRSIAAEWNSAGLRTPQSAKRGGRRWSNFTLRRLFLKPVYAGLVIYQDQIVRREDGTAVRGDWEAIIDETTHLGLVAYLNDKARRPATAFERKYLGSGVYRCGVCDGLMYARFVTAERPMMYACKPHKHVSRLAGPLDDLVETTVLTLLGTRRDDILSRLGPREGFDREAMHTRRVALVARLTELGRLFGAGDIDRDQLTSGTAELRRRIGEIDGVLAAQVVTSPSVTLLGGDPDELVTRWRALDPDMRGKIVNELMTVTVLPTHGAKGVDRDGVIKPEYLLIRPKNGKS
jgi:DNA invertase Pin-like site-specific DNA recombinase